MAKSYSSFVCSCGYKTAKLLGRCPNCNSYNTFVEVTETPSKGTIKPHSSVKRLVDLTAKDTNRLSSGIKEFDRVLGGGIVSDGVYIMTAPPGVGKSTLLLQAANNIATTGEKVLYVSGEESLSQIKMRALRIIAKESDNVFIKSETNLESIFDDIATLSPTLLIIDSIQMLNSSRCDGVNGGDKQTTFCASELLQLAKNGKSKFSIFLVGQMTKEDELRGSRELEHMVDGVFTLELGDDSGILRILRSTKNRFGDVSEVGLFEMSEDGLCELKNPNEYFITKHLTPVCGSAVTAIREGARNLAIEINILSEPNNYTFPSRTSQGISKDFLQIILAVVKNKGGFSTEKRDVYLQTSNGIRVKDSSVGLAIAASVISSVKNTPLDSETVFIGEVSLTGEIKKVQNIDKIIVDFERMGFKTIVIPSDNSTKPHKIKKVEVRTISDLVKFLG